MLSIKHPEEKISCKWKRFIENFASRFERPLIDVCSKREECQIRIADSYLWNERRYRNKVLHERAKNLNKNIEKIAEKCKARDNVVAINFDVMQK